MTMFEKTYSLSAASAAASSSSVTATSSSGVSSPILASMAKTLSRSSVI